MNATPYEPPLVFRHNTGALLKFCYFGVGFGLIFIYSLVNLFIGYRVTMAWLIFVPLILFTGFMLFVPLNIFWHRFGASVEIRNGMVRGINRGGKLRIEGKFADIVEIKSLYLNPGSKPMEFLIVFSDKRTLRFEAQVERCTDLLKALEARSGKQFVFAPRTSH